MVQDGSRHPLTLKAPITTAADDIFFISFYFIYLFILFFREKSLDISCETIHMKYQDLFSMKKKKKKKKKKDVVCYTFFLAL